jgi:C-terminal processing protease CtpA/Prc
MLTRTAVLVAAGLLTTPVMATASPDKAPTHHEQDYSWSFSSAKGRLGVVVMSLTPDLRQYFGVSNDRGLLVAHVDKGSPADLADLRAGDVITAVKHKPVESAMDVMSTIDPMKKGADVTIDAVRDRRTFEVHAVLTDAPQSALTMPRMFEDMPTMDKWAHEMMHDWPWFDGNNNDNRT